MVVDSTTLSIDQVVQAVVNAWRSESVRQTGNIS
jgi:hypothetical protein